MKQDLISLPPLVSYYPRNEPSNETISFRQDGIAPGLLARLHIEFRLDGEMVRIRYRLCRVCRVTDREWISMNRLTIILGD